MLLPLLFEQHFVKDAVAMASSSDDEEEILRWDMEDDRQFVLRPGYKEHADARIC